MALPNGWKSTGVETGGGQGQLYQVFRSGDRDHLYALKRLKNPSRKGRFVNEVETMVRLRPELGIAIPEVVDQDLLADRPWFAMPWYADGSLDRAVADQRFNASPSAGLSLLAALARVLDEVHAAGVAHRDLKPGNVLLDGTGLVLTDFGLCLAHDRDGARLTELEEAVGSRFYVAPENESGINQQVDQRPSDFYAFGKVTWALLAGRRALARELIVEPPNRLATLLADERLSGADALLRSLVVTDPRTRLVDWGTVIEELSAVERLLLGKPGVRTAKRDIDRLARGVAASTVLARERQQARAGADSAAWWTSLAKTLHDGGKKADHALQPWRSALGGALGISVTAGGPPSPDQLLGTDMQSAALSDPPAGTTIEAVVFVVHSREGLPGLPTVVIRLWPVVIEDQLWIYRVPLITRHDELERIADFLQADLLGRHGPFPPARQATLATVAAIVDDTARLFAALVEEYARILAEDRDPGDSQAWSGNELRPIELEMPVDVAVADTIPPELRSFSLNPSTSVTAGASIVCRARISDDGAGVAGDDYSSSPCQARFRSRSGQFLDVMFVPRTRVEGDQADGIYEDSIDIPLQAERGQWEVQYVMVADQLGNTRTYRSPELASREFATGFSVA